MKCIKCGSLAFNLQAEGIEQGDLCDVHYWQERAEALAQQEQERNFCPRCGKRVGSNDWDVHTCTQPQRTWVGLTDEKIEEIAAKTLFPVPFARAIEAEFKENT